MKKLLLFLKWLTRKKPRLLYLRSQLSIWHTSYGRLATGTCDAEDKKLIQSCQIASIDKETVLSAVTSCASSSVIKNEWRSRREGNVPLPLGYDEATGTQLGNADFLVNAVNYLAGNGQWMDLRTRGVQLRLLDKAEVTARLLRWQALNVLLPLAVLLAGSLLFAWRRKARCRKWC